MKKVQASLIWLAVVVAVVFMISSPSAAKETWRGSWYVNNHDSIVLGADQSYFCFDAQIQSVPQRIKMARLYETEPDDSVRVIFHTDRPIFFEGSVGLDGLSGYFRVWFPEGIFEAGNHIFKARIGNSGKSLKLEFTTTVNLPLVGQPCPIFFTEISVKKNGSNDWVPIDDFVAPDTPYADGKQLEPATGNFAEVLGEVHGYTASSGTETRVFYSLKRGELKAGDKVVLVSHLNSAKGVIQYAEGGDYPLELAVTWSGQFNWADRSDLRVYKVSATPTNVAAQSTQPTDFELGQNYPNPFNPSTTIPFSLERPAEVILAVYNLCGELVRHLVPPGLLQPAGQHFARWDGLNTNGQPVPSGTYLVCMTTNGQVVTKKMSLTK